MEAKATACGTTTMATVSPDIKSLLMVDALTRFFQRSTGNTLSIQEG
jgi:hypothetical protein